MTLDDYDEDHCPICDVPLEMERCWQCLGDGVVHNCGEDTCRCLDPEKLHEICNECAGEGAYLVCPNAMHHPRWDGALLSAHGGKPVKTSQWNIRGLASAVGLSLGIFVVRVFDFLVGCAMCIVLGCMLLGHPALGIVVGTVGYSLYRLIWGYLLRGQ